MVGPRDGTVDDGDERVEGVAVHQVVGDQQRGCPALAGEPCDEVHDGRPALLVEGARRFIHQQHVRFVHQGTGDGDALPLTAGQLRGSQVRLAGEPDRVEELVRAAGEPASSRAVGPTELAHDEQLLAGGQRGQQVGLLEHDPDPFASQDGGLVS
ncbi:hypothetical protein ASG04_06200 [Curtobacterium sp. Leaf183]|nr:hypothetical protein ASG04_06200 [Curtobacterium sp. Leaf183]